VKKMKMTYDIAMSAAIDAGNASMNRAGRASWNEEDRNAAAGTFSSLFPPLPDFCDTVESGKEHA